MKITSKSISPALYSTPPSLMRKTLNQKAMVRREYNHEDMKTILRGDVLPASGKQKRVQEEWRRLLEEYYVARLKTDDVSPMAYLLRTCQRNHRIRRMFIKKWKKLQVDFLLQDKRRLDDPDVKLRFDEVFPLANSFYKQDESKAIQRGVSSSPEPNSTLSV
eukprot:scaffold8535_cov132-Cylindrotheca_fusiformis.AAC.21